MFKLFRSPFFTIFFIIYLIPTSFYYSSPDKTIILNLDKAIIIGATNSILLRTIDAKKEVFRMMITERWREFFPKVGINYFGIRNVNVNSLDNIYNDLRLTVQQLVYDGGRSSLDLQTAKLNQILNEKDFKINLHKIKFEIRKKYFKSLAQQGKVFLGKKSLEKMEISLNESRISYKEGLLQKSQMIDILSKYRQAQYQYQKYINDYHQSLEELKIVLNLDYQISIELSENLFYDFVMTPPNANLNSTIHYAQNTREEINKSELVIKTIKNEKLKADNFWLPKVYIGGYMGRNGDRFPLKHDVYGFNFNITFPLGSSTVNANGNTGVQKDGTGIQTYPGFGNQYVGSGINGYNSANIQFFDNLSYSRKIMEGEINLNEAIANYRLLKNQIGIKVEESYRHLKETWSLIKIANSRVYLNWESLKIITKKKSIGHAKKLELITQELEFVKAQAELADAISEYATSCYEFQFDGNINSDSNMFIKYKKNKGNTLISKLLDNTNIREITDIENLDQDPLEEDDLYE